MMDNRRRRGWFHRFIQPLNFRSLFLGADERGFYNDWSNTNDRITLSLPSSLEATVSTRMNEWQWLISNGWNLTLQWLLFKNSNETTCCRIICGVFVNNFRIGCVFARLMFVDGRSRFGHQWTVRATVSFRLRRWVHLICTYSWIRWDDQWTRRIVWCTRNFLDVLWNGS